VVSASRVRPNCSPERSALESLYTYVLPSSFHCHRQHRVDADLKPKLPFFAGEPDVLTVAKSFLMGFGPSETGSLVKSHPHVRVSVTCAALPAVHDRKAASAVSQQTQVVWGEAELDLNREERTRQAVTDLHMTCAGTQGEFLAKRSGAAFLLCIDQRGA